MTESALVADNDSTRDVTYLHESCRFRIVKRDTICRKSFQYLGHASRQSSELIGSNAFGPLNRLLQRRSNEDATKSFHAYPLH